MKTKNTQPHGAQGLMILNHQFDNFFHCLTESNKSKDTFFQLPKEKISALVKALYTDIQSQCLHSDQSARKNTIQNVNNAIDDAVLCQHALHLLSSHMDGTNALCIDMVFEGTVIGIKQEKFSIQISPLDDTETSARSQPLTALIPPLNAETSQTVENIPVTRINNQASNALCPSHLHNVKNQKFSHYIDQSDKVYELVKTLRKNLFSVDDQSVLLMGAALFILLYLHDKNPNQIAQQPHDPQNTLNIAIHQEKISFNLDTEPRHKNKF